MSSRSFLRAFVAPVEMGEQGSRARLRANTSGFDHFFEAIRAFHAAESRFRAKNH